MIDNIHYSSGLGKSDNLCINFQLNCSSAQNVRRKPTFNFSKGDYARARQLLNEINWEALLDNLNTEEAWDLFSIELYKVIQICIL